MTSNPPIKKLQMKPGQRAAFINPPSGYLERLAPLPEGLIVSKAARKDLDFVQLFVKNRAELESHAQTAIQALKSDGLLWICYPKRSSGVETDHTRDEGWQPVYQAGLRPVFQISIDEVWSALRFRPTGSSTPQDLVSAQFSGPKAGLRPIYERLCQIAATFGGDVTVEPRKSYIALARGKQFALIKASARDRLDLGLKLPAMAGGGRLELAAGFGSGSITHRVALSRLEQVDEELIAWFRQAYEGGRRS